MSDLAVNRTVSCTLTLMAKRKLQSAQQARQNFSAVLDAASGDEGLEKVHTVVLRRSEPVAIVVDVDWYKESLRLRGESDDL